MNIFKEIGPLRAYLNSQRSIGLVPTMGALHEGHLSMVKQARQENAVTVCSIYVNPAQFNNASDLAKYPRTLEQDIRMLQEAGCQAVFCPSNEEMYRGPVNIHFDVGAAGRILEGEFRPGHFSGVALVVSKLFNIVKPQRAYFGQKDFQQLVIISQLAEELNYDITVVPVPTMREADGLAFDYEGVRVRVVCPEYLIALYLQPEARTQKRRERAAMLLALPTLNRALTDEILHRYGLAF